MVSRSIKYEKINSMRFIVHLLKFCAVFLLIPLLYNGGASASHSMGADMTYQCLGGNTYRITLSFYRDCIGSPAPGNPYVNINSSSCSQSLGVSLSKVPGTGQEVTPACSSTVTTCNGGSFTGIQEWVYSGVVTLPAQCSDWIFGYSLCCRNAAITTIQNPSTNTFYISSTLNNLITPCNSSPTFSNKPVPFLCIGQQFCFNHGAYDVDGDSLVYSLISPRQTFNTNVAYIAPYSPTNPLNSVPATNFNTATGDICVTPQSMEVTVTAVLVREYRNGVLIGSVERDLQLTVMNCANHLPTLSGINGTSNFTMGACVNQPICFNILSSDTDAGQQLTINWNNSIPGAMFTQTGGLTPTGTFCWTPDTSDAGRMHSFTVTVHDNACPYFGSQIFSYHINVSNLKVALGPIPAVACGGLANITANVTGASGPVTYLWSTGTTSTSISGGPGTYWVAVDDGSCQTSDTITVTSSAPPVAAFTSPAINCLNSPVQFTNTSTTTSGTITSWNWSFGDGSTSTLQNPQHQYSSVSNYNVRLIVTNSNGCTDTVINSVAANAIPNAEFTSGTSCVNMPVQFTDQSTGNATGWTWNFGDGGTSASQNPTHTFTTSGNYQVRLISSNANGCVDTIIHTVNVSSPPAANAGSDRYVCLGGSVNLVASGGNSYVWSPGGQTTSTITVSPASTTTYTVNVINANGCSASDNVVVSINPLPNVNAGSNNVTICQGTSATLTASGANLYSWSPGGQTTASISVSPATTSTYVVTGTNANGCSNTDTVTVNVNARPVVVAGNDQNICAGASATLTASGAISYNWSQGGSVNPLTITPGSTTTYIVTGTDAAGCSSTDSVKVIVNPVPVVTLSNAFICQGLATVFNAGNAGSTFNWSTGAMTQTINASAAGTYSVTVTTAAGCQATSAATLTVGTLPVTLTQNYTICSGQSVTLNANNSGSSYLWSNGATTQSITVANAGNYTVKITGTNGCQANMTTVVTVNPVPNANFTPAPSCFGTPSILSDQSTVSGSTIQSVAWNFGDGTTSTLSNTTHTYAAAGGYSVTLTATAATGCSSSVTKNLTVNPTPVSSVNANATCQNQPVQFNVNASVGSGTIAGYAWTFGDGSSSSSANPTHQYQAAGSQAVTLIVTSNLGCTDTTTTAVTILGIPAVSFTAQNACQGSQIVFTNNSTAGGAALSGYSWNFGNGTTSTATQPACTYNSAGVYSVQLNVTDANGCSVSVTNPVTAYPLPSVNFNVASVCDGVPATFTNATTISGGTVQSYNWTFSDGATSTQISPAHTFPAWGQVQATLVATSAYGCADSITKSFSVNPAPTPAFITQDVCEGSTSYFANNSSVVSGTIVANAWTFGDGNTSANITPYHLYSLPSAYNVTLTVTSNWGCTASVTQPVNQFPNPNPSFFASTACEGANTQFLNLSYISDGTQLFYNWLMGDNSTSQTESPVYAYQQAGMYLATLQVTSIHNCSADITDTVNVYHRPIARFAAPGACSAQQLHFVNQSTSSDGSIVGTMWTFGDGSSSNEINPIHAYADSGNYNVQLITLTSLGCMASASDSVEVFAHPAIGIQVNNACIGTPVSMSASSNTAGMSYQWSMGGNVLSTSPTYNHIFPNAGNYTVRLTATSAQGCDGIANAQITVFPKPDVAFHSSTVCQNAQTTFQNLSTIPTGSINTFTWDFGDSNVSYQTNPSHTYVNPGMFNAVLTAVSNNGCSATSVQSVSVNPNPVVTINASGQGCGPVSANFTQSSGISSGSIAGYLWNFGDGDISNDAQASHVYTAPGTYSVSLHAVSDHGCTASVTQNSAVTVYPDPQSDFVADPPVADIQMPVIHFLNQSQGYQYYQWSFGDGMGSTDLNPSHTFADTGSYNAMLVTVNNYGCKDTMYRLIEVKLHSTLFIANCFTPNGDGHNDSFHPEYTNMKDISVSIFDRWGKMLTQWTGLNGSWDGAYNGRLCPSDTYVYKIVGTGIDGKYSEWVGHVSIVY
jgi:gliding motility-associated-like protein